jgi:glutathione S-transferase
MNYLSVSEARKAPGLRLVLSTRVPNPWGEAAKAVLSARGVKYIPVAHAPMEPNEDLKEWTGVRDAPVAVLDDEPALSVWVQILLLAERLGSGPSLLPDDPLDRALVIGLSHEICGQDGVGWNRRLLMVERGAQTPNVAETPLQKQLLRNWWATPEGMARAHPRLISLLTGLATQLHRQEAAGSRYFVGDRLTAVDLYWACFSQFLAPLPQEDSPMQDWNRANFADLPSDVGSALVPILMQHRDMVFRSHIGLPLDF